MDERDLHRIFGPDGLLASRLDDYEQRDEQQKMALDVAQTFEWEQVALIEALQMEEVYREFCETELAIPVLTGRKTAHERFAGAVETYTIEGLMQDGKALQMGTSHYLGQNFSRAFDVQFQNQNGELEHPYASSWG